MPESMNLTLLMSIVVSSEKKDWHHIPCWGYGGPPSSREHLVSIADYDGNSCDLAHSNLLVYIPDISISLAFGLAWMDDFKEEWTNRFPDRKACGCYVDVFSHGALVFRDAYVVVDGGRTKLPLPPACDKLDVPRDHARFIQMLDRFEGISSFDQDFHHAGLRLADVPWPVFGAESDDDAKPVEGYAKRVPRGLIQ
jgi:hypothetical protein